MTFLSSLRATLQSRRLAAVASQSFSSGLPLGLIVMAIPPWLTMAGFDAKTTGLITAVQLPYALKFLWSPLVDRFSLPLILGKRGWIFLSQIVLFIGTIALALQATTTLHFGLIAAIAFVLALFSATQDIAVDAYAVESLTRDEQGIAVGTRTAIYRAAMWISGALAISVSAYLGWGWTLATIGLLFLLITPSALLAPPPIHPAPPPKTLREAVVLPIIDFIHKPGSLEIAAFLLLYKIADNIAVSLVRPFLVEVGFSALDIGVVTGTLGLIATLIGTFLGGAATNKLGVGRSLWIFGLLQAFGDTGYAAIAAFGSERSLLYGATLLDTFTSGLGTGAFMVFLLRLTAHRFSATQYALFSSLFALGRTVSGPIAGLFSTLLGWKLFFLMSAVLSIPGLYMLHRFVPFGTRDLPPAIQGDSE